MLTATTALFLNVISLIVAVAVLDLSLHLFNLLIAVGSIISATGGTLFLLIDSISALYLLEVFGIVIILGGLMGSRGISGLYHLRLARAFARVPVH
ncbi:MAG: hypothetical protein HYX91_03295 [Chloroflexi bacterium]|nr:hypothetical protein [Chloroflexota bacterium]